MKHLDLFAGIGGMSLGLEAAGIETVGFVEWNDYCQKILHQHWPSIPIYSDIHEVKGDEFGTVDLISGGFPCQSFSFAGKRRGKTDDRYLWPEMFRLIKAIRPTWVIGENVPGIISLALDEVLSDMENEGYSTRAFVLPAVSVDAPHRRDRVWIIANLSDARIESVREQENKAGNSGRIKPLADTERDRLQGQRKRGNTGSQAGNEQRCTVTGSHSTALPDTDSGEQSHWRDTSRVGRQGQSVSWDKRGVWPPEPRVGRVVNGLPGRVDRIKGLGNAVVPPLVAEIGKLIMQYATRPGNQ